MPNSMFLLLLTQENIKLLKKLESDFKRTINSNKSLSKTTNQGQDRYSDFLIYPSFQGVNRLFVLSSKEGNGWESHKQYSLLTEGIKDYNAMIDGRNVFNQSIKNDLKTYENIRKIEASQGDDFTTGYVLDYPYLKKILQLNCNTFKQTTKTRCWSKSKQEINFTGNLDRGFGWTIIFIFEEAKETFLDFSKGGINVSWFYFVLILY